MTIRLMHNTAESHTVSALLLFALSSLGFVAFQVIKSPFSFLPVSCLSHVSRLARTDFSPTAGQYMRHTLPYLSAEHCMTLPWCFSSDVNWHNLQGRLFFWLSEMEADF